MGGATEIGGRSLQPGGGVWFGREDLGVGLQRGVQRGDGIQKERRDIFTARGHIDSKR